MQPLIELNISDYRSWWWGIDWNGVINQPELTSLFRPEELEKIQQQIIIQYQKEPRIGDLMVYRNGVPILSLNFGIGLKINLEMNF